ncbi:MAG: hypothetical protein M0R77_18535 [Gammaproteobacteria bacterium]|nr:hypothetical protein [Gammaproteobacteria bacterium]
MDYRQALMYHLVRYEMMVSLVGGLPLTTYTKQELQEFIKLTMDNIENYPLEKLNRWFGFIQGIIIACGFTTVQAERDATRPHFKHLDFPA